MAFLRRVWSGLVDSWLAEVRYGRCPTCGTWDLQSATWGCARCGAGRRVAS